jgi:hypothetical protein
VGKVLCCKMAKEVGSERYKFWKGPLFSERSRFIKTMTRSKVINAKTTTKKHSSHNPTTAG